MVKMVITHGGLSTYCKLPLKSDSSPLSRYSAQFLIYR